MIPRKFKIDTTVCSDIPVFAETFSSASDIINTCASRTPRNYIFEEYDHFGAGNINIYDLDFYGFENSADLKKRLICGTADVRSVHKITEYAYRAHVEYKDKLVQPEKRVSGGAVSISSYLSGQPRNMWALARRPVRSKIIDLAVNVGVTGNINKDDYNAVGMSIAKVIAKLEKAGYRIRLHIVNFGLIQTEYDSTILLFDYLIKGENESMNYKKMLYPIIDISFHRGVIFNWRGTNPNMPKNGNIGSSDIDRIFDSIAERDETTSEMFEKIYGHSVTCLVMRDYVNMLANETQENIEKRIEAMLLSTE